MLFFAQIGISVFGVMAFLLVTRDERRCQILGVAFGLLSNPFWWMMVVATEQWMTIPVHVAYTYGWVSKAFRLWQFERERATERANRCLKKKNRKSSA